jgi:hypothetical protein
MEQQEEFLVIDNIPIEEKKEELDTSRDDCVVYHVVGVKVGCTQRGVETRCREQHLWEGYVVEVLEVIPASFGRQFAGDREWWWADYYGYERGLHYATLSREQRVRGGRTSGRQNVDLGRMPELARIGGVAAGRKLAELGRTTFQTATFEQRSAWAKTIATYPSHLVKSIAASKAAVESPNHISKRPDIFKEINSKGRKASAESPNHISKQMRTCPRCGLTSRGPVMFHHIKNCKAIETPSVIIEGE